MNVHKESQLLVKAKSRGTVQRKHEEFGILVCLEERRVGVYSGHGVKVEMGDACQINLVGICT